VAQRSPGQLRQLQFRLRQRPRRRADQEERTGLCLAGGYQTADGYTLNQYTGNDLGSRPACFGKGQLVLQASEKFDARLVFFAENDRDGDYALSDLGGLWQRPYVTSHDYEGFAERDILAPTLLLNYHSEAVEISSISGGVWWKTLDSTDLGYTPYPLATRQNYERQYQFTQEFRVASAPEKPIALAENFKTGWPSGVFIFDQNYQQDAVNAYAPSTFINPSPFTFLEQSSADF
jgi:iron complex outermembrane receptor protein